MSKNKIKKFILDLSTAWKCSPEEVVDRLNSMDETEINKLFNKMINKFQNGGFINCLRAGGSISKCKCGKQIGVKKAGNGMPILPSMKYKEIIQTVPIQIGGRAGDLNVGTVRTDGNNAAIFEGNLKGFPSHVISAPSDLAVNESVLDRINRSKYFHDQLRTGGLDNRELSLVLPVNKNNPTVKDKIKKK